MWNTLTRTHAPAASALIRLMVGAVFLSAGIQKFLFSEDLGAGRSLKIGLPMPEVLFPFVGAVEILCGSLVLLGLATRLATAPLLIIMAVGISGKRRPEPGQFGRAARAKRDPVGSSHLLRAG